MEQDTRECRQCGEEIPASARFCLRCGHKVLPEEGMAIYEYVPVRAFIDCPRCGHDHGENVLRCLRCGIEVDVELMHAIEAGEQARERPLFDWGKGIRQGLVGYAILQGLLILVNGTPDLAVEWPSYVVFAILWTVVAALNLQTGPVYGVMLGIVGLEYLLSGMLGPITTAWATLRLHLLAIFALVVGLALVGLIRGRLEFLRMRNRHQVSRLFGIAVLFFVAANLTGTMAGPKFSRGEVRFETAQVVARERFDLKSSRMVFQQGEAIGWVAEFSRATRGRQIEFLILRADEGQERLIRREPRSLIESGTVRVSQTIQTRDLSPGWYVVRIREGTEVLAEGRFRLQQTAN